jgi:molybdenum cofactor biosynthesis protein B
VDVSIASHRSRGRRSAGCAIITVSDTRGRATDPSGAALARGLERAGHRVLSRAWVKDEVAAIRRTLRSALASDRVDAVLLTGGTGIARRDRTPEALRPLIELELPGFGELFRFLSYRQVGSAAWLSRAGAGIAKGRLVVWLPGSPPAVRLAVTKLLGPELGHALGLLGRQPGGA